eukprot:TRINITY_DN16020_c0_g1_i1.p1 TRINITY_DN16020_c0_g1~~TRINITY_DN16020_c0_g1_i1.p1  ORF type:complete len:289 (+),score=66.62 TRINITY_DN16020_c0_g1_i1:48-914(+)
MEDAVKEFIGGAFGGMVGIIAGHPLDSIRIRLQTQTKGYYKGISDCILKMSKSEGALSLYKGILSPILGVSFQNALLFLTHGRSKNYLESTGLVESEVLSSFFGGCVSGLVCTLITTPMELVKIYAQVDKTSLTDKSVKKGTIYYGKKIFREKGFTGLYKGNVITLWRDGYSYGVYFGFYTYLQKYITRFIYKDIEELSYAEKSFTILMSGGITGCAAWISCYPIDVIKSKIQSTEKKLTISDCIKQLRKEHNSIKPFFKGINATLLRAFVVNSTTFAFYELFMYYIS